MTPLFRIFLCLVALGTVAEWGVSRAAEYTRDGGTADWMCCEDKACAVIISQHADPVRAEKACGKLTDADGKTRYTRSNAFRIYKSVVTDGTATLRWTPPTQNVSGASLTDLAGHRIVYGLKPSVLHMAIDIPNPGTSSYVVRDLAPGTWYFAVIAYRLGGEESELSNVVSKGVL